MIARFGILLPQVSHNASDIESERSGASPADGANVLDDFIKKVIVTLIRLRHGQSFGANQMFLRSSYARSLS